MAFSAAFALLRLLLQGSHADFEELYAKITGQPLGYPQR
jgi:hypothetical protein